MRSMYSFFFLCLRIINVTIGTIDARTNDLNYINFIQYVVNLIKIMESRIRQEISMTIKTRVSWSRWIPIYREPNIAVTIMSIWVHIYRQIHWCMIYLRLDTALKWQIMFWNAMVSLCARRLSYIHVHIYCIYIADFNSLFISVETLVNLSARILWSGSFIDIMVKLVLFLYEKLCNAHIYFILSLNREMRRLSFIERKLKKRFCNGF